MVFLHGRCLVTAAGFVMRRGAGAVAARVRADWTGLKDPFLARIRFNQNWAGQKRCAERGGVQE